jgi:hypothetical protein
MPVLADGGPEFDVQVHIEVEKDAETVPEIAKAATGFAEVGAFETVQEPDVMSFGIAPMSISQGYSSDLADFLSEVVIEDTYGEVINPENGLVYVGETHYLELRFQEIPDGNNWRQYEYNSDGVLTYQMPEGALIPWEVHDYFISNNKIIGEYTMDTSGAITIKCYNMDDRGNPTEKNYIDQYVNVWFRLTLQVIFGTRSVSGPQRIVFSDMVIVNLIFVIPSPTINKTATYDYAARTITYTVDISAQNGRDITLTDVMDIVAVSPGEESAVDAPGVLSIIGQPLVTVNDTETWVDAVLLDPQGHGGRYAIPLDGVTLNFGETATVTYSMSVPDMLFHDDGRYLICNTATADGTYDDDDHFEISDDASVFVRAITGITKSGVLNDSNGNGVADVGETIAWEIRIGDGVTNLRGAIITDVLGDGHVTLRGKSIVTSSYMNADATGSLLNLGGVALTLGPVSKFTAARPGGVLPNDLGEINTPPILCAIVRYTTTITEALDHYSNTVSVTYPGDDHEVSETVSLSFNTAVEKAGKFADDGSGDLEYTIKAEIPKSLYEKTFIIADLLSFVDITGESAFVENKPSNINVSISKKDGTLVSADTYTWEPIYEDDETFFSCNNPFDSSDLRQSKYVSFRDDASQQNAWSLLFNAPRIEGASTPSLAGTKWNIAEDCIVTVTYTLPGDAIILDGEYAGITLAEAMHYGIARNTVIVYADNSRLEDSSDLSNPIAKSGEKFYYDGSDYYAEDDEDYSDDSFYDNAEMKGYCYTVSLSHFPGMPYELAPNGIGPIFSDGFDFRLTLGEESVLIQKVAYGQDAEQADTTYYSVAYSDIAVMQGSDGAPSTFSFDFADAKDIDEGGITWGENSLYYVTYKLLLTDDAEVQLDPGTTEFLNTASITVKSEDGDTTYTADSQVNYDKPIIDTEPPSETEPEPEAEPEPETEPEANPKPPLVIPPEQKPIPTPTPELPKVPAPTETPKTETPDDSEPKITPPPKTEPTSEPSPASPEPESPLVPIDENYAPSGVWIWDTDLEEWIFDKFPTHDDFTPPQTGDAGITTYAGSFMALLLGVVPSLNVRRRRKK